MSELRLLFIHLHASKLSRARASETGAFLYSYHGPASKKPSKGHLSTLNNRSKNVLASAVAKCFDTILSMRHEPNFKPYSLLTRLSQTFFEKDLPFLGQSFGKVFRDSSLKIACTHGVAQIEATRARWQGTLICRFPLTPSNIEIHTNATSF